MVYQAFLGKLIRRGRKAYARSVLDVLCFKIKGFFKVCSGRVFLEDLFLEHRLLLGFAMKRFGARKLALAVPIKRKTGLCRALTIFFRAVSERSERLLVERLFFEVVDLSFSRGKSYVALGQYYESLAKNRPFVKTFKRFGGNKKRRRSFFY